MFNERDRFLIALMAAMETKQDPVLSKGLHYTQEGWPDNPKPLLQPYFSRRLDLSHEEGVFLWKSRVIFREALQGILPADLHAEYLGMVKIKQLE